MAHKLISGFVRSHFQSNRKNQFPLDLLSIIINFYNEIISWKIPINKLKESLSNVDFKTFNGPELVIFDYKFMLKLKLSRNKLYFGLWYQKNNVIENALYSYFASNINPQTANKIVESFNYITTEEEFDEIQLIIHDISDPTYSCILEHIEDELKDDPLLILTNEQIINIKYNITRIMNEHKPTNSSQDSFLFRIRYHCIENDMEFRKLYRFDINQISEKGAEMHWRSKYNNYKDVSLEYHQFINNKENLTFNFYVDVIHNFSDQDKDIYSNDDEKDFHVTWSIDNTTRDKLIKMQHGDHLYLCNNFYTKNGKFTMFVGYYYGEYNLFLQQLYPNMMRDKNQDIMITEIKKIILKINHTQRKLNNIRFDAENDIVLIAKISGKEWINDDDDDENKKKSVVYLNIIGIS